MASIDQSNHSAITDFGIMIKHGKHIASLIEPNNFCHGGGAGNGINFT